VNCCLHNKQQDGTLSFNFIINIFRLQQQMGGGVLEAAGGSQGHEVLS